jgi:hypothetical protein
MVEKLQYPLQLHGLPVRYEILGELGLGAARARVRELKVI